MAEYLPIVVLAALAVVFAVASILVSRFLAPRRPHPAKEEPYECGIVPTREPPQRFPVKFYVVAMLFIMFDIEIVFLYPWATQARGLGAFGLWAVVIFSVVLFVSFVYEIARGGLEWGPRVRRTPVAAMTSPERTVATTVRRVGTEGRAA